MEDKQFAIAPEEHWDLDENGNLRGLHVIDPKLATGADIWDKLDEVIRDYAKVNPNEMRLHLMEVASVRLDLNNELGTSKGQLRWGVSIPPGLYFRIQALEPDIFNNRDMYHKFMRKYPGFRICRKV